MDRVVHNSEFVDDRPQPPSAGGRSAQQQDDPSFSIVVNNQAGVFAATRHGVELGGVTFIEKDARIVLLETSILPDFRGKGLGKELTRRVLDQIHAEGKQATVRCPFFRFLIERDPDWASLLNPADPNIGPHDDL